MIIRMPRMRHLALLFLLAFPLFITPVRADNFPVMNLSSRNSSVQLNPNSQAGIYNWTVDGKDIMYQQWFWIRTGDSASELPVDSAHLQLLKESAAGGSGALLYKGSGYSVTIRFSLLGGADGSKASDLSEIISIKNTSSTALGINFFQYANIEFSKGDDTVQFLNPSTVQQSGGGVYLDETVVNSTGLVHHQADVYPAILNSLNDGSATTLNDSNYATGDATWGFQWQQMITPGNTFTITKDMNVSDPPPAVPEPTSVLLLGTLITFVACSARKRYC